MHFDLHVGRHDQFTVLALELHARDRIAESVDFIAPIGRCRRYLQRMLEALLVGSRPRHEVQQMVRMHDVGGVGIPRFVSDVILPS